MLVLGLKIKRGLYLFRSFFNLCSTTSMKSPSREYLNYVAGRRSILKNNHYTYYPWRFYTRITPRTPSDRFLVFDVNILGDMTGQDREFGPNSAELHRNDPQLFIYCKDRLNNIR